MDQEIHAGYELSPYNYLAYDLLNGNEEHIQKYADGEKDEFERYLKGQLDKIQIPNKDVAFLRERMLTMYPTQWYNYFEYWKS
jgi:hypothetical protein